MRYEDYFSYSGKGPDEKNEDLIGMHSGNLMRLDFICDGMSSYGFGAMASQIVMQEILQAFSTGPEDLADMPAIIRMAADAADKRIWRERLLAKSKFGAVLGGIISGGSMMYAFWIGDVKIFQVREQAIIYESEEHSLCRAIGLAEGQEEGYGNIVTASLNGRGVDKLEVIGLDANPGDVIVICSDGIWKAGLIDAMLGMDNNSLNQLCGEHIFGDDHSIVRFSISQ